MIVGEPARRLETTAAARLDLLLPPEAVPRLRRAPGFRALGLHGGRVSARLVELWGLNAAGEAMALRPGALSCGEGVVFGGMIGRRRRYVSRNVPGITLEITAGAFVAGGRGRVFRLTLAGPALAVAAAAWALAEDLPLAPLPAPLPALAAHRALGVALPPPPDPIAGLDAATPLALAARQILAARGASLRAQLAALARAPGPASAAHDPEPVHQTRVALRRLRAAIAVFAPLCAPLLAELRQSLRDFSHSLAPARDWDVFMAGIGRDLALAFPDDPAPLQLLPLAIRRWHEAYAALGAWRAGEGGRRLDVLLAILPLLVLGAEDVAAGHDGPDSGAIALSFGEFARERLERRARKLRRVTTLAELGPDQRHRLRLDAKRLRYLGEIFAPCFPPRRMARFLRRLAALQEWLGTINDAATTTRLVRGLTPDHARADDLAVAQGMALGLAAAGVPRALRKAERARERLQALKPFWQ